LTRVSNASPTGDSGVARAATCSSASCAISVSRPIRVVFTRTAIGARWFIASASAVASAAP
jgi:hypothetical protein